MSGLVEQFIAGRLIDTGLVESGQVPTRETFDRAYEADIEAIVRRVLAGVGRGDS